MAGLLTRIALGLGLVAGTTACGGTETTVDSAAPTTVASMVPMCAPQQYSPPMSAVAGVPPSFPAEPSLSMLEVLESYGRDHPDAWAGVWLSSTDGANNVSVGIVGDVNAHRDRILALRPQPTDVELIHPRPSVTDTTTVAENPFELVVVSFPRTLVELEQLQRQIGDEMTSGALPLEFSTLGVDNPTNVVRVGMPNPTDDARRLLAERQDPSAICVEEMARFSPAFDTTDTTTGAPIRD